MRNRLLAGAALCAALTAGCRRAPPETPPANPSGANIAAPNPSSIVSPLGPATTDYTNEMQEASLRDQAAQLGISRLGKPSDLGSGADNDDSRAPITYEEGLARTKEYSRQFEAERHAIDRGKPKSIDLAGSTPSILPGKKEGAPIETDSADAAPAAPPAPAADPGPKGP